MAVDKKGRLSGFKSQDGRHYKIATQSGRSVVTPLTASNGVDIDHYAVFAQCDGFWQQISPWYMKFGNAQRYLFKKIKIVETVPE